MRRTLAVSLAVFIATTSACAAHLPDFDAESTTGPSATEAPDSAVPTIPSTTTTEPPLVVPEQLTALEIRPITIVDGDIIWVLTVAVAASPAERSQGLMNVADLGDLDGMLFVWEASTDSGFWMDSVVLPLDIAFFGEDLTFVDSFTMPLCSDGDCPTYPAAGPFRYAVEVLESTFTGLTPAATLSLDP